MGRLFFFFFRGCFGACTRIPCTPFITTEFGATHLADEPLARYSPSWDPATRSVSGGSLKGTNCCEEESLRLSASIKTNQPSTLPKKVVCSNVP